MAVCTNGRIRVSSRDGTLMDTVQNLLILFVMALLAGGVHFERKIPRAGSGDFGMRKTGYVRVTVHTGNVFLGMDRGIESRAIDGQRQGLAAHFSGQTLIFVAKKTSIVR